MYKSMTYIKSNIANEPKNNNLFIMFWYTNNDCGQPKIQKWLTR